MRYIKTTLKNGMRVLLVPMKDAKSFTLLVLFGTGSKYEIKKNNGISHFLEHMFFKGTRSRPRPGEISQALDDIGAEHNAFTAKEYTGYWVKAAARHFPLALDIVSDILLEPLFDAREIEKERGVIFQEMNLYRDTPQRRIHTIFESLLYGDQPAGWDIIGTTEALTSLSRKDFLQYRKTHYVGSNAVLVVAGACKEAEAIRRITKVFSDFSNGKPKQKIAVREHQTKPAVHIEYKKTDQTHLVMGGRAYDMFDERRFAALVLATILGGKTSSRLFQDIREKRGLAYTVSANAEQFTDSGYFSVYAGVPHEKAMEVVRRVIYGFKKIREEGVVSGELRRAKDYWRGQFAISLESSDEVASFFGGHELFYRASVTPEELMDRIEMVGAAEIQQAARDIFQTNGMNAALIGPHKGDMAFEELLTI